VAAQAESLTFVPAGTSAAAFRSGVIDLAAEHRDRPARALV
jgi:hypothetical protein